MSDPREVSSARAAIAALLLAGAGAYLLFGAHKGLGIFLVLIAAVLARTIALGVRE